MRPINARRGQGSEILMLQRVAIVMQISTVLGLT